MMFLRRRRPNGSSHTSSPAPRDNPRQANNRGATWRALAASTSVRRSPAGSRPRSRRGIAGLIPNRPCTAAEDASDIEHALRSKRSHKYRPASRRAVSVPRMGPSGGVNRPAE